MSEKDIYITAEKHAYRIEVNNLVFALKFKHYAIHKKRQVPKCFLIAQYASTVGATKSTIFTIDSDVALLGRYFTNAIPIRFTCEMLSVTTAECWI